MKRMEQLKFMVDLNWRIRFEKLDNIFSCSKFIIQFNRFMTTETGRKWLTSEEGKKFQLWQEGYC